MASMVVLLSTIIPSSFIVILFSLIMLLYYVKKREFLNKLKEYPNFSSEEIEDFEKMEIHYSDESDENLKLLKEKYDLAAIAGYGSDIDQILNLLRWVHMLTTRAANPSFPEKINALTLIGRIETENQKLNCWLYSTILNDSLLAMGFKSRKTHMKPYKSNFKESHIVIEVYSRTLEKWIFIDADFCTYLMDEKNNILGLKEIRQRLIQNKPLKINKEEKYNVSGIKGFFINPLKRKTYLWYISKNIFRFSTPRYSTFDYESRGNVREDIELIPLGYNNEEFLSKPNTKGKITTFFTTNSCVFW
ncbi:MAG: hypothetical protein ACTSPM_09500 [Candidatus Heimdallarchaeota archaeon]